MTAHIQDNEESYFLKTINTEERLTRNLRYFSQEITY